MNHLTASGHYLGVDIDDAGDGMLSVSGTDTTRLSYHHDRNRNCEASMSRSIRLIDITAPLIMVAPCAGLPQVEL